MSLSNFSREYMKIPTLFFLALIVLLPSLKAQDKPDVLAIRARYQAVNMGIAACDAKPEEPCGYYLDLLSVNKRNAPWAAVGIFQSEQQFWYYSYEGDEGSKMQLAKINIASSRSDRKEHEEFLFDEQGNLCFYFFKMTGSDAKTQEARFYFKDGILVEYLENISPEEKDYQQWGKAQANDVLEYANRMLQQFENSH